MTGCLRFALICSNLRKKRRWARSNSLFSCVCLDFFIIKTLKNWWACKEGPPPARVLQLGLIAVTPACCTRSPFGQGLLAFPLAPQAWEERLPPLNEKGPSIFFAHWPSPTPTPSQALKQPILGEQYSCQKNYPKLGNKAEGVYTLSMP